MSYLPTKILVTRSDGTIRGSWYHIVPYQSGVVQPVDLSALPQGANMEMAWTHASLVPQGETRPVHISNARVRIVGVQKKDYGNATLTIEAPAESSKWKLLASAVDGGNNGGDDSQHFDPAVILTPADVVCLQICYRQYVCPGVSWWWRDLGPTFNRIWLLSLEYTIKD